MKDALVAQRFFDLAAPAAPSPAVQELLRRQKQARKSVNDGADAVRALLARDSEALDALKADEREAADRLGSLSLDAELGGGDTKALASARRELDAIRARRAEVELRLEHARQRIAEAEREARRRLAALCEEQAAELDARWRQTRDDNDKRWPALLDEVNRRVADEVTLRDAVHAARQRAREAAAEVR